jgi:hypothetical protein
MRPAAPTSEEKYGPGAPRRDRYRSFPLEAERQLSMPPFMTVYRRPLYASGAGISGTLPTSALRSAEPVALRSNELNRGNT